MFSASSQLIACMFSHGCIIDQFFTSPTIFALLIVFTPQSGDAALMLASRNGHTDCVRLLMESGADKDAKNKVRGVTYRLQIISYLSLCVLIFSLFACLVYSCLISFL